MKFYNLRILEKRVYFSVQDVAEVFNIKYDSAKVLCSRYVENGIFIRLKKDFYLVSGTLEKLEPEHLFKIANNLQIPSYISLFSALQYHGLTKEQKGNFIESICLKRTKIIDAEGKFFNFFKIKKELFYGFNEIKGFKIADKEKAFIDIVYLYSFGKYSPVLSSINLEKLDKEKIEKLLSPFPEKTKNTIKKILKDF